MTLTCVTWLTRCVVIVVWHNNNSKERVRTLSDAESSLLAGYARGIVLGGACRETQRRPQPARAQELHILHLVPRCKIHCSCCSSSTTLESTTPRKTRNAQAHEGPRAKRHRAVQSAAASARARAVTDTAHWPRPGGGPTATARRTPGRARPRNNNNDGWMDPIGNAHGPNSDSELSPDMSVGRISPRVA